MKTQQDLIKGCGKIMDNYTNQQGHRVTRICGMQGQTCRLCQALLQQNKEMIELIDKWFSKLEKKRNIYTEPQIICNEEIEDLKSKLIGDETKTEVGK